MKIEKKNTLVLLSAATITPQHLSRMGLDDLVKLSNIYIFDCRIWFGRENLDEIKSGGQEYSLIEIASRSDFQHQLEKICPDALLDFIGQSELSLEIRKMVLSTNAILVAVNRGSIPSPGLMNRLRYFIVKQNNRISTIFSGKKQFSKKVNKPNKNLKIQTRNALRVKLSKISLNLMYIKYRPHISMISGRKSLNFYYLPSRKLYWVKSIDALEIHYLKKQEELIDCQKTNEEFIVYIDDNLDGSLDWLLLDQPSPISRSELYAKLNKLFDLIEANEEIPIIIAAHPTRVRNSELSKNLNNRRVVFENTAEMVLRSKLVLNLTSGAVGLAVLANKPIIFITTNKLNRSHVSLVNFEMKSQLKCIMVNIDEVNVDVILDRTINARFYHKYITNYMDYRSQGSQNPWETLIKEVFKIRDIEGTPNP